MTLHTYALSPSRPGDQAHLAAIARIHLAAWLTTGLTRTIYYGPPTSYPGIVAVNLERHTKAFVGEDGDGGSGGERCRFAVVVDDALPPDEKDSNTDRAGDGDENSARPKGRVIAAIKYYLVDPTATATANTQESDPVDQTNSSPAPSATTNNTIRTWPPYSNRALGSEFWARLVAIRARLIPLLGPHVLVDNLYTDPAHHRRGAGGMLMRLACADADAKGWPSMLEASPAGLGVYESVGFTRFKLEAGSEETDDGVNELWVDLERWEGGGDKGVEFSEEKLRRAGGTRRSEDGWYEQVVMVRPATNAGKEG